MPFKDNNPKAKYSDFKLQGQAGNVGSPIVPTSEIVEGVLVDFMRGGFHTVASLAAGLELNPQKRNPGSTVIYAVDSTKFYLLNDVGTDGNAIPATAKLDAAKHYTELSFSKSTLTSQNIGRFDNIVWFAQSGEDSTGTGTIEKPYKTINKSIAEAKKKLALSSINEVAVATWDTEIPDETISGTTKGLIHVDSADFENIHFWCPNARLGANTNSALCISFATGAFTLNGIFQTLGKGRRDKLPRIKLTKDQSVNLFGIAWNGLVDGPIDQTKSNVIAESGRSIANDFTINSISYTARTENVVYVDANMAANKSRGCYVITGRNDQYQLSIVRKFNPAKDFEFDFFYIGSTAGIRSGNVINDIDILGRIEEPPNGPLGLIDDMPIGKKLYVNGFTSIVGKNTGVYFGRVVGVKRNVGDTATLSYTIQVEADSETNQETVIQDQVPIAYRERVGQQNDLNSNYLVPVELKGEKIDATSPLDAVTNPLITKSFAIKKGINIVTAQLLDIIPKESAQPAITASRFVFGKGNQFCHISWQKGTANSFSIVAGDMYSQSIKEYEGGGLDGSMPFLLDDAQVGYDSKSNSYIVAYIQQNDGTLTDKDGNSISGVGIAVYKAINVKNKRTLIKIDQRDDIYKFSDRAGVNATKANKYVIMAENTNNGFWFIGHPDFNSNRLVTSRIFITNGQINVNAATSNQADIIAETPIDGVAFTHQSVIFSPETNLFFLSYYETANNKWDMVAITNFGLKAKGSDGTTDWKIGLNVSGNVWRNIANGKLIGEKKVSSEGVGRVFAFLFKKGNQKKNLATAPITFAYTDSSGPSATFGVVEDINTFEVKEEFDGIISEQHSVMTVIYKNKLTPSAPNARFYIDESNDITKVNAIGWSVKLTGTSKLQTHRAIELIAHSSAHIDEIIVSSVPADGSETRLERLTFASDQYYPQRVNAFLRNIQGDYANVVMMGGSLKVNTAFTIKAGVPYYLKTDGSGITESVTEYSIGVGQTNNILTLYETPKHFEVVQTQDRSPVSEAESMLTANTLEGWQINALDGVPFITGYGGRNPFIQFEQLPNCAGHVVPADGFEAELLRANAFEEVGIASGSINKLELIRYAPGLTANVTAIGTLAGNITNAVHFVKVSSKNHHIAGIATKLVTSGQVLIGHSKGPIKVELTAQDIIDGASDLTTAMAGQFLYPDYATGKISTLANQNEPVGIVAHHSRFTSSSLLYLNFFGSRMAEGIPSHLANVKDPSVILPVGEFIGAGLCTLRKPPSYSSFSRYPLDLILETGGKAYRSKKNGNTDAVSNTASWEIVTLKKYLYDAKHKAVAGASVGIEECYFAPDGIDPRKSPDGRVYVMGSIAPFTWSKTTSTNVFFDSGGNERDLYEPVDDNTDVLNLKYQSLYSIGDRYGVGHIKLLERPHFLYGDTWIKELSTPHEVVEGIKNEDGTYKSTNNVSNDASLRYTDWE